MGRMTGGGNRLELFPITAGSPDAFGSSLIAFTRILNSDIVHNDDGTWSITLAQEEDSQALYDFIEDYLGDGAVTEDETVVYENADTDGGGASSSQDPVGFILYGPRDATNRKTLRGLAYLQGGAGSWKQENAKSTQPALAIKSFAATEATTIALAKFNTAKVAAPGADKTVPLDSKGVIEFLAKGTE